MFYLLLSILSSTLILIIFKSLERFKIRIFNVIVINYIAASISGLFLYKTPISISEISTAPWLINSIILGIMLIILFYTIGLSSQKAGITITSIASKVSVIIPVLFSILYYSETITWIKILAIILGLTSIVLLVFKNKGFQIKNIILPALLFFGIGVLDSIIKYSQATYLDENTYSIFSGMSFTFAGIIGISLSFFNKNVLYDFAKIKVWITGIILGLANFGSMYFLLIALNKSGLDSSVVFSINNLSIVMLSVIAAISIFKEKVSVLNWIGIILSLISLFVLTNL